MKQTFASVVLTFASAIAMMADPGMPLLQRIMTAADSDRDSRLSPAEFKKLDVQAIHHGDEHFAAGDLNKDGFIDLSELPGALSKQTWFAILVEGVEAAFKRLDLNQDGKLDASEYRNISKMGHHSDQHFKGADLDSNGFLDFDEFTTHAERKLRILEDSPIKAKTRNE